MLEFIQADIVAIVHDVGFEVGPHPGMQSSPVGRDDVRLSHGTG